MVERHEIEDDDGMMRSYVRERDYNALAAELAEAIKVIWAVADDGFCMHGVEGMDEAQQAVSDFTLKHPRPLDREGEQP